MYRYDAARRRFEDLQRLDTLGKVVPNKYMSAAIRDTLLPGCRAIPMLRGAMLLLCRCHAADFTRTTHHIYNTPGAHDLEVMHEEGRLLLAIANQGDGISCDSGSAELYAYDAATQRFALRQRMRAGCATYVASYRQEGRLRLAVGIERVGGDAANQSSYHTYSPIYEWT